MPPNRSAAPAAVVFDCDGVLTETGPVKTEVFRTLFADRPEHLDAIVAYHQEQLGLSRYEKFEWIYRELFGEPLSAEARARLGEQFAALAIDASRRAPTVSGAEAALRRLRELGIPLYVASGIPQKELEMLLDDRGWSELFVALWGAPTPKQVALQLLCRRHDVDPDRIVFVGDGLSDYRAAAAVGVRFVLRETEAQAEQFRDLDVPRLPDLNNLAALISGSGPVASNS